MGFHEIVGDITKFKGDVIINSVGIKTIQHGGICRSILEAANSRELNQIIDGLDEVYEIGDYFITDSFGLPSPHILHLIAPHAKNDNSSYQLFQECLRRVLNECQKQHFYKVGIPSIGTGANKYDKDISRSIIKKMCDAYCQNYPKMDITFIAPDPELSLSNDEVLAAHLNPDGTYHDEETMKKFKKSAKLLAEEVAASQLTNGKQNYNKAFFDYKNYVKSEDTIIPSKELVGVMDINDYVDAYIEERNNDEDAYLGKKVKKRINLYLAYGKKSKKSLMNAGSDAFGEVKFNQTAPKETMFKIIFAMKMTLNDATRFLNFFGLSFAHMGLKKEDDAVQYLLANRQYSVAEIDYEFKKRHINKPLFAKY